VYGINVPQRVLGVKDDGSVGPQTVKATTHYPNKKELFDKLWNSRKKHFQDIAKNGKDKFLKGWLNRLNDFKYEE
jgi:lysozyme family protein